MVTEKATVGFLLLFHQFHRLLEKYQVAKNIRSSCGDFLPFMESDALCKTLVMMQELRVMHGEGVISQASGLISYQLSQ